MAKLTLMRFPAPSPSGCCPPAKPPVLDETGAFEARASRAQIARVAKARIPGGRALVGTDSPQIAEDVEGPLRHKQLKSFEMGVAPVSNAEFAAFVAATGYVTEAERFGWSFVFWAQVPEALGATRAVQGVEWWRRVEGAMWRDIHAPGDRLAEALPDHPVVHVSWHDAMAYAAWAGGRLPNEAEWEHAARGGLGDVRFCWGDAEPDDDARFPCNIWQGRFPQENTGADGYMTTAPGQSFAANGYGLYGMLGNVWEWTAEPFRLRSAKRAAKLRQAQMRGYKLVKGGSFLCHRSYCYRYRIAARTGNSPDSTTTHTGFRVAWDLGRAAPI